MQFIWQTNNIPVFLFLEVQFNSVPVAGISPTVEVYKASNDTYVDFNTNTFVASGGNRFGALTEVPSNSGLYKRQFDPRNFAESGNQVYYMRYRATVPSGFQGLTSDRPVSGTEVHYFTEISGTRAPQAMGVSFVS
jgi:hypothetical protein